MLCRRYYLFIYQFVHFTAMIEGFRNNFMSVHTL